MSRKAKGVVMGKQIKVEVIIGAKRIPKTYEEGVTYEQVAKESAQSAYSLSDHSSQTWR